MFGNKLDNAKRKQSLTEALFVLGVGGAEYGIDRVSSKVPTKIKGKPAYNFKYSTAIDDKVTKVKKAELPSVLNETFTDGIYRTVKTREPVTLYRTYGGNAKQVGAFATTKTAANRIQVKIDSALLPEWKNSRIYEAVIEVPKGQILNIGKVEKQFTRSGTKFGGGGDQILMPQGWGEDWIKEIRKVPSK